MALYKIVKSWTFDEGFEVGKIVSLSVLHPSLETHVVKISDTDEVEVSNLSLEVATPEAPVVEETPQETPKRRA